MSFYFVPTQRVIENSKKIRKYHYGSISSHHRLREDEKGGKEKLSFRSVPTWRIIENSKNKKKNIYKYHYGIISGQNSLEKVKKERKYELSFRFVPSWRIIKNSKKIAKKFKKLKNASMASFKARIGWKRPRKKENKYFRSASFQPNA